MREILQTGAFELAEQIRTGKRTAEEVLFAHLDEIIKWNPQLNALIEDRFLAAIQEARDLDQKIRDGATELPPLAGVPFTIKEMIAVQKFRNTLGSIHRERLAADRDGTVVERLRKAGAILLGTTNVPELGFWFECSNPVYGRTSNPYDLTRTSGGSSGGEAALIGAGCSPFGIGSDIGGSIRLPAAFCGVFGHKPSRKIIPITGHYPLYHNNASEWRDVDYPLTVLGPMARTAADLYPLMKILVGPDQLDQETSDKFELKPRVQDWKGKTVWLLPSPQILGAARADEEVEAAVRRVADSFEVRGATVKEMKPDIFKNAVPIWFASLARSKKRNFTDTLSGGKPLSYAKEFFKILGSRASYTFPALAVSGLEVFSRKHADKLEGKRQGLLNQLENLKNEFSQLLGDHSILIMPVHPRVAPKHGSPMLRPFDFAFTAIFNSMELPATAVPMGLDEGLPLSVQIVGGLFQDHLTISAAEVLEADFGGWRKASLPS